MSKLKSIKVTFEGSPSDILDLIRSIASGRSTLEADDGDRPLFAGLTQPDRFPPITTDERGRIVMSPDEAKVRMEAMARALDAPHADDPEPIEDDPDVYEPVPPGTKLFRCSRCNAVREVEEGHPCKECGNPEFGLVTVGPDGSLVTGWPDDEAEPPKAKTNIKRPRKSKVEQATQ